jgi:hypothetical protein
MDLRESALNKNVKFEENNYENRDDITLWKSINSDISDNVPIRQEKSKIQYEKYTKPSKSDRCKSEPKRVSFEESKSSNFNFYEMMKNQNWDEDEMNQLLDLNNDDVAPKTLTPTLQEHESCNSSKSDMVVAEVPQMISSAHFTREENDTTKYLLK